MRIGRSRGFTVVEMMVAVAVAGVLLTLAVPSFTGAIARARLEGAVNEFAIDLQYARTEAIRRRTSATVAVDGTGTAYVLSYVNPQTGAVVSPLKAVDLPESVTLTPNASIEFTSLRGLAPARTIDAASSKTSATLRVLTTATGRIRACSPSGSFNGYPTC